MTARTLAQAIDHLVGIAGTFDTNAGPVLSPLLAACRDVGEARTRLDGLEEARAMMATRSTAYDEAAKAIRQHVGATNELGRMNFADRTLELARFLCPGLEVIDDPALLDLGPVSTREELEASEAGAVAQADDAVDRIAELEGQVATVHQRAEELEAELATEKAEANAAREHVTELAATLEATERDLADERTKVIDLTERAAQWEGRARILNPLFGGPRITEELNGMDGPEVDTLNRWGVGLHADRIAFVLIGQELEREEALVMAAHVVALADRGEGLFTAIYRKVCNA